MQQSKASSDHSESVSPEFPRQLDIATASVYGLAILSGGLFLFLPLVNLLHPSPWQRSLGTIHSFSALLTTVVVAYTGHLAFPLLRGSSKVLPQMRTLTFWSTVITTLGIFTDNIAYARYRANINYGVASVVPLVVVNVGALIVMQNSTAQMHKYILGWIGLMVAFGVTVPIAMLRVSANPKFPSQPFNSQKCDSHKPETRTVTSWIETCSRMSVPAIAQKTDALAKPATKSPTH